MGYQKIGVDFAVTCIEIDIDYVYAKNHTRDCDVCLIKDKSCIIYITALNRPKQPCFLYFIVIYIYIIQFLNIFILSGSHRLLFIAVQRELNIETNQNDGAETEVKQSKVDDC